MKFLTILSIITFFTFNPNNTIAQNVKNKETVIIKTSAECNMCKERIEKEMAYTKGVVSSTLNVESAKLTVIYKPHKTTPEKLRETISKIGYDADNIKANIKTHNKLPHCCQKGGMTH